MNRILHIDKSLVVADSTASSRPLPLPALKDGQGRVLCQSEYFTLEILNSRTQALELNTLGQSFHALTVIEGTVRFSSGGEQFPLSRFASMLVRAVIGAYCLEPLSGGFRALKSSL